MSQTICQTNEFQGSNGMSASFACRQAGQQQGQLDVFKSGQDRDKVEGLEHKSHMTVSPVGQVAFTQRGHLGTLHMTRTGRGPIDSGDGV